MFVVALGNILATTIVSPDTAFATGVLAFGILIALQFIASLATSRSHTLERIINGRPSLLLLNGEFCHEAMRKHRMTDEEVRAAIRTHGLARLRDVKAVALETDGTLSVVEAGPEDEECSSLSDVPEFPKRQGRP